jgi:hypothetical protein
MKRTLNPILPNTWNWDLLTYTDQFNPKGFEQIGKYGVVDYFLFVYNEHRNPWNRHYLEKVLHGILSIDYPIRLKVVYDEDTPSELMELIQEIVPAESMEFLKRPPVPNNLKKRLSCEWAMIWAYNNSDADYICFNHSDDIPFPNRVYLQIQSLLANPKAALSLAGSWFVMNSESRQIGFHEVVSRGSPAFGIPSSYMYNKHILSKIIPNWKLWKQFTCCPDLIMILDVLKHHEVVAVHYPLFCYNFHGIPIPKKERLQDDKKFFKYIAKNQHKWNLKRFKIFPKPPVAIDYNKIIITNQLRYNEKLFRIWHQTEWVKPTHLTYHDWVKQYE